MDGREERRGSEGRTGRGRGFDEAATALFQPGVFTGENERMFVRGRVWGGEGERYERKVGESGGRWGGRERV